MYLIKIHNLPLEPVKLDTKCLKTGANVSNCGGVCCCDVFICFVLF